PRARYATKRFRGSRIYASPATCSVVRAAKTECGSGTTTRCSFLTEVTISRSSWSKRQRWSMEFDKHGHVTWTLACCKVGLDRSCRRDAEMPVLLRQGLRGPPPTEARKKDSPPERHWLRLPCQLGLRTAWTCPSEEIGRTPPPSRRSTWREVGSLGTNDAMPVPFVLLSHAAWRRARRRVAPGSGRWRARWPSEIARPSDRRWSWRRRVSRPRSRRGSATPGRCRGRRQPPSRGGRRRCAGGRGSSPGRRVDWRWR